MRKLIIFFLPFFIFYSQVKAEECKYTKEINDCSNAVKWWYNRNINDFVCINDQNAEKRIYQIVLDKKFKEVDKIAEDYLYSLQENKDYYFWENKKQNVFEALFWIEKLFWDYWDLRWEYKVLCDWQIIKETLDCLWTTSISQWKDFLKDDKSDCMWLVSTKLDIYFQVASDILKLNKQQVRFDSRKTFVQSERNFYDVLSDLFSINLWYLERIWMKTPTLTKRPYK